MQNKHEVIDFENYRTAEEDGAAASSDMPQHLAAGTTLLLGQYTITDYLNCGGFGITYRATDSLNREVVIKECFPSAMAYRSGKLMGARTPKFKAELEDIVQHFVKEAHHLANAKHPNIVHVHQIFEENDTAYMAMDYIAGEDLLDMVESDPKRFTPPVVEDLVHKMLHAISYMHGRGMLHRDISPDNILINESGDPVLIDFGSAREYAAQAQRAYSKLKFVKDGYSPQEFYIAGSEQGTYSDLYSFAASIHHVITGKAPEDGQKRLAALAAKNPDPYVSLAGTVTGYPARLLRSLDKALEILPDNRIQTADEWLELLGPRKFAKAKKPAAVAAVVDKLPSDERLPISRTGVERLTSGYGQMIAAGLAAVALLGAVGFFGMQSIGRSDQVIAESAAPVVIEAAPVETTATVGETLDVVLPSPKDVALAPAPVALDRVASDMAQIRTPTPPLTVAVPLSPLAPVVGSASDLEAPAIVETFAGITSGIPTPVARPANLAALATPEIGPGPSVPLPEIAATDALSAPTTALAPISPTSEVAATPLVASLPSLSKPLAEKRPTIPEQAAPRVFPLTVLDTQTVSFSPAQPEDAAFVAESLEGVTRTQPVVGLPAAPTQELFSSDVTAPPPFNRIGPVAAAQIAYAHWDVRMPFEANISRVRNANIAEISSITEGADLNISGNWIAEGVILYSFNGQRLDENASLSMHVLKDLNIDPDGYARATVRYRDPSSGILDRGLLAVPVVRAIGLADGTVIEAQMMDENWVLTVTAPGDYENGLQVGDVLKSEVDTGAALTSPEALSETLATLVAGQAEVANLMILRGGERQAIEWPLARSLPSSGN